MCKETFDRDKKNNEFVNLKSNYGSELLNKINNFIICDINNRIFTRFVE